MRKCGSWAGCPLCTLVRRTRNPKREGIKGFVFMEYLLPITHCTLLTVTSCCPVTTSWGENNFPHFTEGGNCGSEKYNHTARRWGTRHNSNPGQFEFPLSDHGNDSEIWLWQNCWTKEEVNTSTSEEDTSGSRGDAPLKPHFMRTCWEESSFSTICSSTAFALRTRSPQPITENAQHQS